MKKNANRLSLVRQGSRWVGNKQIIGNSTLPEDISNFDPQLITMLITNEIRRDANGNLDRAGLLKNATQNMISIVSKLTNISPTQLQDIKFGFIDQPLINYNVQFQSGLLTGGDFLNGVPTEDAATVSIVDCGTYDPLVAQDLVVDSGTYAVI